MTPKRREVINLSWFFYMPLLQQISADQMFKLNMKRFVAQISFETVPEKLARFALESS